AAAPGDDLALRERIARLWMLLDEPLQALEQIQLILEQGEAPRVVDLLEGLLVLPASRESMTPAAPEEQAQRARRRKQRLVSVRERASQYLRSFYQEVGSTQDVVRMLEVAVETAQDDEQRVRRLKQIIKVRLNELEDAEGAFGNVCHLVSLVPEEAQFRRLLHQLAERLGSHDKQAALLVSVAEHALAPELKIALLAEAAAVHKNQLGDDASSIALYQRVLDVPEAEPDKALAAARELDPMLERAGRFEERCSVLERLAEL